MRNTDRFRIHLNEFGDLLDKSAFHSEWEPIFDFIAEQVNTQTSIRDFLQREKVVHGFLAAYLNIVDYFACYTEPEFNKGYADMWLEPIVVKYPDIQYGCLIELKYISRGDYTEAALQEKITKAKKQINNYQKDPFLQERTKATKLLKLILVFNGWELVHKEQVE